VNQHTVTGSPSLTPSDGSSLHGNRSDKAPLLLRPRPSEARVSPSWSRRPSTRKRHRIMQTLLLVASVFSIIISILSVQIPRYLQHQRKISLDNTDRRPLTDGSDSSNDDRTSTSTASIPKPRKPWDPPFPTTPKSKDKEKERGWLVLPPMTRTKHDGPSEQRVEDEPSNDTAPTTHTPQEHFQAKAKDHTKISKEDPTPVASILWTTVAILAGVFLVLLFGILIAHCLAWFIVYKTEARLGEARRGLVQGGEMRLCLCARG
jgi:hypothetical protein